MASNTSNTNICNLQSRYGVKSEAFPDKWIGYYKDSHKHFTDVINKEGAEKAECIKKHGNYFEYHDITLKDNTGKDVLPHINNLAQYLESTVTLSEAKDIALTGEYTVTHEYCYGCYYT